MGTSKQRAKRKKPMVLSTGRPPLANRRAPKFSSRATRACIRSYHQIQKQLAQATAEGDVARVESLQAQLEQQGGLKLYQQASIIGQSNERGGDSSKVLLDFLQPVSGSSDGNYRGQLRMLEVGALSTNNACSRSNLFDVERIDLNSQEQGILQQDFMKRPLPEGDEEAFDVLSLSLVLNYVPNPASRGDMLRRTTLFLKSSMKGPHPKTMFPCLFLVLPAPCLLNSRYLNKSRLAHLMHSFGYTLFSWRESSKLIYSLWTYEASAARVDEVFPKVQVNPGASRNNFAIVLEKDNHDVEHRP
ncbi:MAG: hypothetical protein M1833_001454 [Piccolia ochrophora]|nr:MAG: hypothetical protein M1833_001454 [Piccolia ochrophora]